MEASEGTGQVASRLAAAQALHVDRMTGEVVSALTAGGVETLLLKGPALASWLYVGEELRSYVDCDLLVRLEDQDRSRTVLEQLGFERGQEADHLVPEFGPLHADTWFRPSDRSAVDLHRALSGMRMGGSDVWAALSERAETLSVGGVDVRIPGPAGRALTVALHVAHHGEKNERPHQDLERALVRASEDTWRESAVLADRLHAMPSFALGLRSRPAGDRLADRLGLPSAELAALARHDSSGANVALGLQRLAGRRGFVPKAQLVLAEFFPTPRFMRWWSPLARRGPLGLALAYPWRIAYLLLQALPGVRAWRRARLER